LLATRSFVADGECLVDHVWSCELDAFFGTVLRACVRVCVCARWFVLLPIVPCANTRR
jgi:hypothetical protein